MSTFTWRVFTAIEVSDASWNNWRSKAVKACQWVQTELKKTDFR